MRKIRSNWLLLVICGLVMFVVCFFFEHLVFADCVTTQCHAGISGFTHPHEPVAEGDCLACHRQIVEQHPLGKGKSFTLVATGAALCRQCHDAFSGQGVHEPVAEGDCLACHQPHGSNAKGLLVADGDQLVICLDCHDGDAFEQKYVHGPAASGSCTGCHDPHQSVNKVLLTKDSKSLCFECHAELAAGLQQAGSIHQPLEKQPCSACHEVHGGPYPHLLIADGPALCFKCHEEVGNRYKKAKTKHDALYTADRCGNCHRPHYAAKDGLLAEDEQHICLRCHGKNDTRRSHPLRNMRTELQDKKYLHGPLVDGQCSACHEPHGSDYFRLLNHNYPATFYAPYRPGTYAFCLSCHEENLLRFPDTSIYTRFRDGKRNLHYLHVSNTRKGRSCRACHQPHAGNGPKLINEKGAPFGNWNIPLRLVLTPTGGSCAPGCHRRTAYDRQQPVSTASPE
jgi:predicted CXXCH cytochrome family protein